MKKILIIGATSAIAEATARIWAKRGDCLYLLARNQERLRMISADLRVRGAAAVHTSVLQVDAFAGHQDVLDAAIRTMNGIDVVLVSHGSLGEQLRCEKDFSAALRELNINAISVLSLVTHVANRLEEQGYGTIAVISSVAGDRGRKSNYVYGAAKSAVSTFLQGLRQRLHKSGVHVLTIKPGFVDTPMTSAFPKGILWSNPQTIGGIIARAVESRKDVIYAPWFWHPISLTLRLIPERLFKKLKL